MLHRETHRNTEVWRCTPIAGHSKQVVPCRRRFSLFEGSVFEGIRYTQVKPWQILLVMRHVLEGYVTGQSVTEVGISGPTISHWRKRLKAVLGAARIDEIKDTDGIGGPLEDGSPSTVEIDETKVSKCRSSIVVVEVIVVIVIVNYYMRKVICYHFIV
jgi:hypothetical protein